MIYCLISTCYLIHLWIFCFFSTECADSIAEQLVERARKGTSDNITVVVVFFKDPHLIAKSSWLNKMEATYDKNNTNSTFDNDVSIDFNINLHKTFLIVYLIYTLKFEYRVR